jgi:hypothetical protein
VNPTNITKRFLSALGGHDMSALTCARLGASLGPCVPKALR